MEKSDPVKHFLRYLACEVSDLRSNGFVVNGTLWEVRCHRYYIYICIVLDICGAMCRRLDFG